MGSAIEGMDAFDPKNEPVHRRYTPIIKLIKFNPKKKDSRKPNKLLKEYWKKVNQMKGAVKIYKWSGVICSLQQPFTLSVSEITIGFSPVGGISRSLLVR